MRPSRLLGLAYLLPIGGVVASSVLLTLGEDGGPVWARLLGTVVLAGTGIYFGYQYGRLAGHAQCLMRESALAVRSEAETGVLVAAIKLAGGLARADLEGWGGPRTCDEKQLVEAVAVLGQHAMNEGLFTYPEN